LRLRRRPSTLRLRRLRRLSRWRRRRGIWRPSALDIRLRRRRSLRRRLERIYPLGRRLRRRIHGAAILVPAASRCALIRLALRRLVRWLVDLRTTAAATAELLIRRRALVCLTLLRRGLVRRLVDLRTTAPATAELLVGRWNIRLALRRLVRWLVGLRTTASAPAELLVRRRYVRLPLWGLVGRLVDLRTTAPAPAELLVRRGYVRLTLRRLVGRLIQLVRLARESWTAAPPALRLLVRQRAVRGRRCRRELLRRKHRDAIARARPWISAVPLAFLDLHLPAGLDRRDRRVADHIARIDFRDAAAACLLHLAHRPCSSRRSALFHPSCLHLRRQRSARRRRSRGTPAGSDLSTRAAQVPGPDRFGTNWPAPVARLPARPVHGCPRRPCLQWCSMRAPP